MRKQITKIKYDGRCVKVDYNLKSTDPQAISKDNIAIALASCDKPMPEFIQTFQNLKEYVEQICDLANGYCEKAEVRGVTLSYSHDILGAVITVLVKVKTANSPVVINTPHLPSKPYNEDGEEPLLPFGCYQDLLNLLDLTEKYIDGERDIPLQEEMFSTDQEKASE